MWPMLKNIETQKLLGRKPLTAAYFLRTTCIQDGCMLRNRHSLVDFQFKRAVWRSFEISRSAADVYEMKKGIETAKSEKAYIEIRNHILQFENAPSEPLSEVKLASLLGMSRTPIREALRRLESEGIITTYGTRGSFVNIPTLKDIRDIFEVRMFLEAGAAKLAAEEIDLIRLEEFEDLFTVFKEGNGKGDFVELGRKFHFFIVDSSSNKVLKDILDNIYTKLDIVRLFSYSFRRNEAVEEHLKIVRALKKRDADLSYTAMQNHLKNAFNTLNNIL